MNVWSWIGALSIVGIILYALRGYVAYAIAFTDVFFMFVPEGQVRFIMKGKSLHRVVANIKGKTLCTDHVRKMIREKIKGTDIRGAEIDKEITCPPEYLSVDEIPEGNLIDIPDGMADPNHSSFNRNYGVFGVGMAFIHTPLKYWFRWDKWEKRSKVAGYETVPREEPVGSLFFRYPYPILSKDTEIKGNISYDIQTLVTMEAVNPAKALFATLPPGTWLQQAEASVLAAIRTWASPKEIDKLREAKSAGGQSSLSGAVKKVNESRTVSGVPHRSITELFGMKVVAVNLVEIQVSTADPEMEKILLMKARAVQQKLVDIEAATGRARALTIVAEGQATATRTVGAADAAVISLKYSAASGAPNGAAMFIAEAARDAVPKQATVYAPGGGMMPAITVADATKSTTPATTTPPRAPRP